MARSGQAVARLLASLPGGPRVVAVDSGNPALDAGLREAGVELALNDDGTSHLDGIGLVIKSPGVPQTAPVIEVARERGIPVIGELEIAWRSLNNPFVAVTGTNGKTTVVEWLGHVWREAEMPVVVAGNVGTPLSSLPSTIDEYATVICECSSFQLEDSAAFAPEVAVLLNVTPDHLDRHGTLDAYRDAKLRIFAGQSATDYSIFDADLVPFAASDRPGSGATIAYGVSACAEGGCLVRLRNEVIEVDGMALVPVSELALSGEHNVRNAMAVAAAALCGGVPREAIARGLRTFAGVPHRLERVAEIDGVAYVNDSKATNVAAAQAALGAFGDAPIHAILGGSLKGGSFDALYPAVAASCKAVYLIGEAADALEEALAPAGVPAVRSGTLEAAVEAAHAAAAPGDVVLLAPACASFDAFRDYEAARRSLPGDRRSPEVSGAIASLRSGFGIGSKRRSASRKKARPSQPVEYQLIITATMCLVAFGAVMVFSASSTSSLLGENGDGAYYLKRTLMFGAIGLIALHFLARTRLSAIRQMTPMLLAVTFAMLVLVLAMPAVNGAKSWIVAGPLQVQPSEIMKIVLLLYGAHLIAARPQMTEDLRSMRPYLLVVAGAFALIMLQPDFGTTMVTSLGVAALLIAGGAKLRHLAMIAGAIAFVGLIAVLMEPYRMARLTTFLNPGADPSGAGFQTGQASIALGSGGLFGVGLGESVQKAFYLPEAHTDMISAVIGEEIGLAGITVLVGLYMLIGYGGFRTAQKAKDRYGRLLAAALTAIILIQATINLYAAMGMAPLTGVTLPFVSYGNSSLIVTLAAVGLLLNIANGGTAAMAGDGRRTATTRRASSRRPRSRPALGGLRVIDGERETRPRRSAPAPAKQRRSAGSRPARRPTSSGGTRAPRSDSGRRDSGARSAGPRRRRRAR